MSNESESVMDAVKPEVLDVAVSHNLLRAIHGRCMEVGDITAPLMFSTLTGKAPDPDTCVHMINGLMHLLAVVDDMTILLRDHIDFTAVTELEESELKALKKAIEAHPVIAKAIQYGNETPKEKLNRIMAEAVSNDGA